jgi:hypothetical protein
MVAVRRSTQFCEVPYSDEETGAGLGSDGRGRRRLTSGFPGHHLARAHNATQIPIAALKYLVPAEAPENTVKRHLRSSTPPPCTPPPGVIEVWPAAGQNA